MNNYNIGEKIKDLLRLKGISAPEFAKKINFTKEGVYSIFRKEDINTELLKKIAEALEVDISCFFTEKGSDNINDLSAKLSVYKKRIKELERIKNNSISFETIFKIAKIINKNAIEGKGCVYLNLGVNDKYTFLRPLFMELKKQPNQEELNELLFNPRWPDEIISDNDDFLIDKNGDFNTENFL